MLTVFRHTEYLDSFKKFQKNIVKQSYVIKIDLLRIG